MRILNFALVGYGAIGKIHLLGAAHANFHLNLPFLLNNSALISRQPRDYPMMSARFYGDLGSALADGPLDYIDVCTPNDQHVQWVEIAAKYGLPIYMEKPIAHSVAEAAKATRIVKDNNLINGVAIPSRSAPGVQMIKQELAKGTIGDIIGFKMVSFHKSYLDPARKNTWRTLPTSGGGAMLDLGIHSIDCLQYMLGKVKSVEAKSEIFFQDRTTVDEITFARLTLENGVTGSIEASRIYATEDDTNSTIIFGSAGSLELRNRELRIYRFSVNTTTIRRGSGGNKYYSGAGGNRIDGHGANIASFASQILGEESYVAKFEDALSAQIIVEACYESSQRCCSVDIPPLAY